MPDNANNEPHVSSERAKDRFVGGWRFGGIIAGTLVGIIVGMLVADVLPGHLYLVAWLIGWLTWIAVFLIFYYLGEWQYKRHLDRAE